MISYIIYHSFRSVCVHFLIDWYLFVCRSCKSIMAGDLTLNMLQSSICMQ